ncbi:aspartate aminotransferase [Caminicella sporogenes DSM 14501]|uniref:Aminotransferase n=1 Tax=Caminicella sporogenes DSM 14501 TaxID=1121266 RepID=A0A1M6S4E4_9FIRM|nr:pyridoxal phosphate-dependent aminotransferase [Caminicella sporogenes]RKD27187.1 aspartate aminotransferase [Caminicella sporogenes]WIF95512.1 pyridoxal phosphate-dependent aminotransferase [Caminicella sporogenes]SHK39388.1 aspartate aminotransferase [Caminicella sporogenes DSM 14501]
MNNNLSVKNKSISPSVTLAITAKAKKMKADGIDIISFGAGEPDFNTPAHIRKAAIDAIEKGLTGYTASAGLPNLKQAICEKLKNDNNLDYTPENIVVSNGAKHSLFNTLQVICNPGDEVIIPIPYWVSYPEMVKMADAKPVFVKTSEENGFKLKKESLLNAINNKTKAIILNSPNNPTGTVYTKEELKEIAEIAVKHNIFVISDEIYEKLIYEGNHISIASLGNEIKKLTIVINGMSKAYAMTGWRIGYLAADSEIAKIVTNIQSHATSNPNTIAQYASIEALKGDQSPIKEMTNAFNERRKYMVDKINSIDKLSCRMPEGAFYVMVNISKIIGTTINGFEINSSMDFAEYLLDTAKVAVIPGAGFGLDNYIRLSYATSLDNIKEGLNRIEKAIK